MYPQYHTPAPHTHQTHRIKKQKQNKTKTQWWVKPLVSPEFPCRVFCVLPPYPRTQVLITEHLGMSCGPLVSLIINVFVTKRQSVLTMACGDSTTTQVHHSLGRGGDGGQIEGCGGDRDRKAALSPSCLSGREAAGKWVTAQVCH